MKGEKLYHFLNTLNQSEKNQCTRFLLPGGKKPGKYARLYKILTEQENYDEQATLHELYGVGKSSDRRFEATCDYLGDLVIQALAQKDAEINSRLPLIRKSREKGLIRLSGKHLQKAFSEAAGKEDFEELLQLHQEHQILREQYDWEVPIKNCPWDRSQVFEALTNLENLQEMVENFRSIKWEATRGKAETVIEKIKFKMDSIHPGSTREKYHFLRLKMRLDVVLGKNQEACEAQEKIMELVFSTSIPRIKMNRIEESGHMIRVYHNVGRFEDADLELMRLRAAPVISHFDQANYWRYIITGSFISAFTLGKTGLAEVALEELDKIESGGSIPPEHLAKLFFYAAHFLAMSSRWREARNYLQRLHKFPLRYRKLFSWQPKLLLAICYIEEEEQDLAYLELNRLQRKGIGQIYPKVIVKGLERILYASPKESMLLLNNLKLQIDALYDDPEAKMDTHFFDVGIWIDSRRQKKTMIEVARDQQFKFARRAFSNM